MARVLGWINDNKEWIFSGVGVTIAVTCLNFIINHIQKNKISNSIEMKNKGEHVTQIGIQNNYGETKQEGGIRENRK